MTFKTAWIFWVEHIPGFKVWSGLSLMSQTWKMQGRPECWKYAGIFSVAMMENLASRMYINSHWKYLSDWSPYSSEDAKRLQSCTEQNVMLDGKTLFAELPSGEI